MGEWFTPDQVNGLTTGGAVVFAGLVFFVGLVRGWIVTGKQHRSDIEFRDNLLASEQAASRLKDQTINEQAETIRHNTATGEGALKMLQTFRELTTGGGP